MCILYTWRWNKFPTTLFIVKQLLLLDYKEVCAPVARLETVKFIIISLVAQNNWTENPLNGCEICFSQWSSWGRSLYIEQPQGCKVKGNKDKVRKLKENILWVETSSRAWNTQIDKYLPQTSFIEFSNEPAFYIKVKNNDVLIMCLYM